MNVRLYNARILTMEEERPVFWGEVWVFGNRILRVLEDETDSRGCRESRGSKKPGAESLNRRGQSTDKCSDEMQKTEEAPLVSSDEMQKTEETPQVRQLEIRQSVKQPDCSEIVWDQEIDCHGSLLMPGFKDAHTHSAMTFLRSYADDVPLQQWLHEKVFPMEARLSGTDIYQLTKLAVLEYLTSGITSIFEMYLDPGMAAKACIDMGMRCVLTSGLNDFTSSIKQQEEEYLKWNSSSSLISYKLGFHAEYTCSRLLLEEVALLADKYHAPVYTHLAETAKEVAECRRRYGMTPAVFLDRLGIFAYGGGGYHCVHMTDEDMEVFLKNGMYAVTNPASNLKLASGIAPIAEFGRKKIPVAIGTDGPASNNCLDMFREMFLTSGLSKIREQDAESTDAGDVLRMATVSGARAMGLNEADVLAEGKLADLIMIDLQSPNMQPIHNIPKNLVYSGSKQNIQMTMINGEILYRDGRFYTSEGAQEIYAQCDRIIKRIFV